MMQLTLLLNDEQTKRCVKGKKNGNNFVQLLLPLQTHSWRVAQFMEREWEINWRIFRLLVFFDSAGSAGAVDVDHLHRITESLLFVAFVKCVMSMINTITISFEIKWRFNFHLVLNFIETMFEFPFLASNYQNFVRNECCVWLRMQGIV